MKSYSDDIAPLLAKPYRYTRDAEEWPNYVEERELTEAHIPELADMLMNPEFDELAQDDPAIYAPLHALRALGQLKSEQAIAPLIEFLSRDDLGDLDRETLPVAVSLIGGAAVEAVGGVLHNEAIALWSRVLAANCLEQMAKQSSGDRSACIAVLTTQLEHYATNDQSLDSTLVNALAELQATEAASLIEQVFAHKELDEMLTGSWPGVQVRLGLKNESDFSPEDLQARVPEDLKEIQEMLGLLDARVQKPQGFGAPAPAPSKKKSKKKKKR
ncbi:MAG: DUF1186 domain-containing protein [Cyanobacteria bacterium P01_E01_bin.6]